MSWAATQFIGAAAEARRGATVPAQDALVAGVRCALDQAGRPTVAAATVLPSPLPTGDALLREIAMQKYAALFLNVEAWNDYKRTCLPDVAAVKVGTSLEGVPVPGRLYYGLTERQTNPNIPVPDQQPARNTNDPAPCP